MQEPSSSSKPSSAAGASYQPASANAIKQCVIVGGGTAGWIAAAVLARSFGPSLQIQLVESAAIGTVGVGEATIPQIRLLNRYLGLDEHSLLRACMGTYKLGIEFRGWRNSRSSYLHAFGDIGLPYGLNAFHQYWLRAQRLQVAQSLWDYSLNTSMAKERRFMPLEQIEGTPMAGVNYAFHFDATLYARVLRNYSEKLGVTRIEGTVKQVEQDAENGFIRRLVLEDGREVSGELFIDCSGFRGLLIEETLQAGYEDWRQWLPCDRALAIPSQRQVSAKEGDINLFPYTQSIARSAGWQWRIPLQHRTGNGYVYCSDAISDDEAAQQLVSGLDGPPLAEPRQLRFTTGRRKLFWSHNCIAMGLASGFMEPLESTSIHLIQTAVNRLIQFFPDRSFNPILRDEYNRQTQVEFERIRDFLILHYRANERDEAFWQQCAQMAIPATLQHKIDLFTASGDILREDGELFTEGSWLQVMWGQGLRPERYHPMVNQWSSAQLHEFLSNIRKGIKRAVNRMPSHERYIAEHCAVRVAAKAAEAAATGE